MRLTLFKALFLALMLLLTGAVHGQERAIQTRLFGSLQRLADKGRIEEGSGYGAGAELSTRVWPRVRLRAALHYEVAGLEQSGVLNEWQWDYWENTYIPFLPGANLTRINQELVYTSTDSIYSAVFDPTQKMNELRFSLGLTWEIPLGAGFTPYLGLSGGLDLYKRQLEMEEHWSKRFDLDTLQAGLDYEYPLDVLHFAPPKKGQRLFVMPILGLRYTLSPSVDLDGTAHYIYYPGREAIEGVEKLFNISPDSEQWFPFKSKLLLTLGLTFKY